jgi:hypothetical protein
LAFSKAAAPGSRPVSRYSMLIRHWKGVPF